MVLVFNATYTDVTSNSISYTMHYVLNLEYTKRSAQATFHRSAAVSSVSLSGSAAGRYRKKVACSTRVQRSGVDTCRRRRHPFALTKPLVSFRLTRGELQHEDSLSPARNFKSVELRRKNLFTPEFADIFGGRVDFLFSDLFRTDGDVTLDKVLELEFYICGRSFFVLGNIL